MKTTTIMAAATIAASTVAALPARAPAPAPAAVASAELQLLARDCGIVIPTDGGLQLDAAEIEKRCCPNAICKRDVNVTDVAPTTEHASVVDDSYPSLDHVGLGPRGSFESTEEANVWPSGHGPVVDSQTPDVVGGPGPVIGGLFSPEGPIGLLPPGPPVEEEEATGVKTVLVARNWLDDLNNSCSIM